MLGPASKWLRDPWFAASLLQVELALPTPLAAPAPSSPPSRGSTTIRRRSPADLVEVLSPDEGLVLDRPISSFPRRELRVLQLRIRGHAARGVLVRELEHREVERVEPGEGHELEAIPHPCEVVLEPRDARRIQFLPPVERGRAVVGEEFSGEPRVDGIREGAGFLQIGARRLAP